MTPKHLRWQAGFSKTALLIGAAMAGVVASAAAQQIEIDSISRNGSISFSGAPTGTYTAIEWCANLVEPGRTNWHNLNTLFVSANTMTSDIPMFFRVRTIPFWNEAVGVWRLNGNPDDSRGTNNGTWSGTPNYTNGMVAGAQSARFDQSTRINISPTGISTTSLTVNLWFKLDSTQGYGNPLPFFFGNEVNGNALYVHLTTSLGRFPYRQVTIGNWVDYADSSGAGLWEYNQWHMLTVVRTTDVKVYIDGNVVVTQTTPLTIDPQVFNLNGFGTQHKMDGTLAEVLIWSRALSKSEVAQLFIMQRGN